MGQKQYTPYSEYEKEYTIVSKNQNDELLVRHKTNGKEFMLRKIIVKSEQQLQERINLLNKRKKVKSEHLLNVVDFKPIFNDKICGDTQYISLLIEYPFESLYFQTLHRLKLNTNRSSTSRLSPIYFQEHQLWSILYSCALGLQVLYLSDLPHQSITKDLIFIDKEGVVKIGDPILLGARRNFQRVIQLIQNQKNKPQQAMSSSVSSSNFYSSDKNQQYLKRLNHIKQPSVQNSQNFQSAYPNPQSSPRIVNPSSNQSSLIVSPQLISLCKDHQYYFFDKEKSDVFVLGALMVQLAMLDNLASVNLKENVFRKDFAEFTGESSKLRERYSPTFLCLIQQMTKTNPRERLSLNQVVQKIQEFSIQQNSQSDINSIRQNSTDIGSIFYKKNNALPSNVPGYQFYSGNPTYNHVQSHNLYQDKNIGLGVDPSYSLSQNPSVKNSFTNPSNVNPSLVQNVTSYQPFPSFSLPLNNKNTNFSGTTNVNYYHESAVKTVFSKNLPLQVKYAESPLIVPVSNMRNGVNKIQNPNLSTPFHHLDLTESNQKKTYGRQIQKQSIVQNKFTLFGQNHAQISNSLFDKYSHGQPNRYEYNSERFSINKFGNIQIPNNSNNSSVHTSTIPTPRFQSSLLQSNNHQISDLVKPLFTPTFTSAFTQNFTVQQNQPDNVSSQNFNVQQNQPNNVILEQNKLSYKTNTYDHKFSNMITSYDAKKQGFSISDNYQTTGAERNQQKQPYFSNSSVGYTLQKYRPQSNSSQIVKGNANQNSGWSNKISGQVQNVNNSSSKKGETSESFVQKFEYQQNQRQLNRYDSSTSSIVNGVSNLMNDKNQTGSNSSSQNTVKKENSKGKRQSSQKKYNFYKKQMTEKLQKIDEPVQNQLSHISSISMIENVSQQKNSEQSNTHSPIHRQVFPSQGSISSHSQNSITPVTFKPELHSVYVQQKAQNGSFYRGYKLNNLRNGSGTLIFADSGFYQGQFNKDLMQGQGKLYYNEKDLAYQGHFLKGNFHGHGVLYNINPTKIQGKFDFAHLDKIQNSWKVYDGNFKDDEKAGRCRIQFSNEEQFQGYCQNNTFQGHGRFKTLDGDYIDGVWVNNALVQITGEGKIDESHI